MDDKYTVTYWINALLRAPYEDRLEIATEMSQYLTFSQCDFVEREVRAVERLKK